MSVRLGTADQAAQVRAVRAGEHLTGHCVPDVPVVVDLTRGAVGIAGPIPYARGLARWIIAQLLALHSQNDLSLIAIVDDRAPEWQWIRWTAAAVATTESERGALMDSVSSLLTSRLRQHSAVGVWPGAWTVVLIDPAQLTAGLNGLRALLRDGPRVGITAVCVAAKSRMLPQGCGAVARVQSALGERLDLSVTDLADVIGATCERVSPAWAEQFGRDLAPLRDGETEGAAAIATEVRLVDALGLTDISDEALLLRWRSAGRPSTALGVTASGPHVVDLVRDGPHGLIAGSTGSGKSELLRSLVAGLATNNSPADLAFVLIDYKGGAAFAECADLPHTIAMITDLDPHLTRRALISLDAELRRRESLFATAGVGDLDAYREHPHNGANPLPRLVLVVDEFASLVEELPDFINGLVAIAQRGRSLGLHLLLATQRPNGVVSADIKANMALRIALRVTDPADSADVLGTSDAAGIDKNRPGRAFARVADGLVEFQTARVDAAVRVVDGAELALLDEWNRRPLSEAIHTDAKPDLHLLVDAAREAARGSVARPPDPVWLAPLPEAIAAANCRTDQTDPYVVEFGLVDRPEVQQQTPLSHDLAAGGSLAFVGGPRSGRTSILRTVASVAADQLDPADLQLYAIDCAGGSLRGLAQLPSCATALSGEDPTSVARLVGRLSAELDARLARLAEERLGDAADARRLGLAMPAVLVVLDGWEGFAALSDSLDAGHTVELLLRVARDGAAAGFTVMLSGDRALLGIRTSAAISAKLLLRLTEPTDYAAAGVSARAVPSQMPAGRAIAAEDGAETQLAILGADPAAAAQWSAVAAIARRQREAAGAHRTGPESAAARAEGPAAAILIKPLPDSVALRGLPRTASQIVLGVGGDEASTIHLDLVRAHSHFLIAGPARSGRSTAARVIASQALADGVDVLVAGTGHSPLTHWAGEHGVPVLSPDGGGHVGDGQLTADRAQLIVIDDSEVFAGTDAEIWLLDMITRGPASVLACARSEDLVTSFRGVAVAVKRNRTGLLLRPSAIDGELLGVRIAPPRLPLPPGRGLLVTDKVRVQRPDGLPIQVAMGDP